jgi:predicted outer membrane repeat protein
VEETRRGILDLLFYKMRKATEMKTLCTFRKLFGVFRVLVVLILIFSQLGWTVSRTSASPVYCKVDADATGANDGTTWTNAFTDLQLALGASSCTEIWVAAGTYRPTTGTDRTATFQLKNGVALYGGFVGTETIRDQRSPLTNLTILSGDLNGDDVGFTNNTENAYHVVTGANGATLDGFTIASGNASGNPPDTYGGGMFNDASSPTITNVTFSSNFALVCGGGMANLSSSNPTLTGVIFSGNQATANAGSGKGGGLYNEDSSPVLENVTFTSNATMGVYGRGGGMYNFSGNPSLTNVTFNGNTATNRGGGLYTEASDLVLERVTFSNNASSRNGGGMYNDSGSPTLTNVTFSGNSAEAYGGGMWNSSGSPILTNVTFSDNSADEFGGGMYNDPGTSPIHNSQIRNAIFWGNSAEDGGAQISGGNNTSTVSDSVVQAGCPAGSACTRILTADPRLGTLGDYGSFTQTIPLQAGSSAIDAGNDATCATTDQRGIARPHGAYCDIGAFEYYTPIISGNAGVANATITYTGSSTSADGSGNYTFTVPYGWSGTVIPSKVGYTFSPPSMNYDSVNADQTGQDYTAMLNTYTISGNAGVGNATITFTGGSTTANSNGDYSFTVPYEWTGSVTPSKTGYTFLPDHRDFTNVTVDQANQDFTATLNTYTISGNAGVADATITYTGGSTTSNGSGNYTFIVPYGWTGTVTPSKTGYTFLPIERQYTDVQVNMTAQDYTATAIVYMIYLPLIIR